MMSHRLQLGKIPGMHVDGPYGCLEKMFHSCIGVLYASQILFTVIGHHPISTWNKDQNPVFINQFLQVLDDAQWL
jgi:hypothetical protein